LISDVTADNGSNRFRSSRSPSRTNKPISNIQYKYLNGEYRVQPEDIMDKNRLGMR